MSNSQNKKNEQQNNLCTTLTGQWKKGELPFGCYYIKDINDETFADHYTNNGFRNGFEDFFDDEIEEVLAPVPSYEEWQDTENRSLLTTEFSNEIDELNEENQQLKELLKECKEVIYDLVDDEPCQEDHHGYCQAHRWMSTELCPNERGKRLLTKIDEVLK